MNISVLGKKDFDKSIQTTLQISNNNKPDLRRSKHLRMRKGECTHFAYSVLSRYF